MLRIASPEVFATRAAKLPEAAGDNGPGALIVSSIRYSTCWRRSRSCRPAFGALSSASSLRTIFNLSPEEIRMERTGGTAKRLASRAARERFPREAETVERRYSDMPCRANQKDHLAKALTSFE